MAKKDYKDTMVMEAVTKDEKKVDSTYADASKETLIELLEKKEALIKSYEAEFDKKDDALKRAEARVAGCSEEYDKLQQKAETLEKALSEAEDEIDELEDAKDEVERLKSERDELLEKIKDKDNASKSAQFNLERSHKAETDKLNDRVETLTAELKEAKAEIKKLTADLKKANKKAGDSEVIVDKMSARYLEDNLREELMLEDEEAVNAQIDECVDEVIDMFKDLKANIKAKRAARFTAKKQIMLDEAATRAEKAKNAEEIKRLKESLATLQHVIEAKEAEEA